MIGILELISKHSSLPTSRVVAVVETLLVIELVPVEVAVDDADVVTVVVPVVV